MAWSSNSESSMKRQTSKGSTPIGPFSSTSRSYSRSASRLLKSRDHFGQGRHWDTTIEMVTCAYRSDVTIKLAPSEAYWQHKTIHMNDIALTDTTVDHAIQSVDQIKPNACLLLCFFLRFAWPINVDLIFLADGNLAVYASFASLSWFLRRQVWINWLWSWFPLSLRLFVGGFPTGYGLGSLRHLKRGRTVNHYRFFDWTTETDF